MLIMFSLLMISTQALSFSFSPPESNGAISLNNYAQTISIFNNSSSSETMNLTLTQSGLLKMVDRCSGKILKPKTSCYILVSVDPNQNSFSAQLKNNNVSILDLNFTKTLSLIESLSLSVSSLNFGTIKQFGQSGVKQVIITNTGTTKLNPVIQLSSHIKLLANRCGELRKGSSCSFFVVLDSDASLGYSGPVSGQSISIKPSISGAAQSISISATMNVYTTCLPTQHMNGLSCEDNIMSCSSLSSGIGSGTKTWNPLSSSFGSCIAANSSACLSGYSFNAGSCSLISPSVYETKYEPSEDLLAIPAQTFFYTNNGGGNFGRAMIKFTLTQKSYINSLDIKVGSMPFMGFHIANASNPSETNLDGHISIAPFSNFVSGGSGIQHFTFSGQGLLLEAGNYYIVDQTGYVGGSYTMPLYYSPPNVAFSVYGQEPVFGYGSSYPYNGGVFIPFVTPPNNYAPYFKLNTTAYVPPANSQTFSFSPTLKDSTLSLSNSNSVMSSSGSPIISWGYTNKYIDVTANGKFYVEFKFINPYYAYAGGNFLNSDPAIFYNAGWPFALTAGYTGVYSHYQTPALYLNSSGTTIPAPTWGDQSVVMFALDLDNNKIWMGVNGVWGSGNPATNTGGLDISGARGSKTRFYFAAALGSGSVQIPAILNYTAPSGFVVIP